MPELAGSDLFDARPENDPSRPWRVSRKAVMSA